MKRAILCLILTLLLTVTASAAGVDALYVTCEVRSDGSAEYSVAVSAQFESVEKTFTIPLAGEGISKVSASGDWTHQSDGGWDRVELRSGDGFIGRQTFVVTYRTAAAEADGTMDLPLVGSRWEMDVAEFSFDVTMPTPLEKTPALISGYSGEMLGIVDLTATGFTGVIAEGLMAHESLRVELTLPEDYFGHARLRSFLGLDWGLIFLGLVIAASGVYWLRTLRSRRPVVQSRVLPPEGWTPAEVPTILDGSSPNMRSLLGVWGQLGISMSTTPVASWCWASACPWAASAPPMSGPCLRPCSRAGGSFGSRIAGIIRQRAGRGTVWRGSGGGNCLTTGAEIPASCACWRRWRLA